MPKISEDELNRLEAQYQGIKETIQRFERDPVPPCAHCGSMDTASVQVGVIGRTIALAGATTKVRLIANGPKPGSYYCNQCGKYFG